MLKFSLTVKYTIVLSLSAVAIWAYPLWFTPEMTGIGDWGFAMHRFEAIRLTVIEYNQWPGHNPWSSGGAPLLGHAAKSLLSIQGLLVLAFGTYWGLRIGVLTYLCIGFIGAWKLSGIWWKDRYIKLIFCFYTIANPAMIFHVSGGHLTFQTFWLMPLAFYFLLRFGQDKWSGLKAAIVLGAAFNESPMYMVQFGMLILGAMYVFLFVSNYRTNSKPLARWAAIFIPVFLALIFYRTITTLQIALDYSRVSDWKTHYQWISLLKFYLFPYTKDMVIASCKWCATSSEVCSYVGFVAFVLSIASFRKGFRWWHGMIILLVWAGIGNDSYFHIMYWIQKLPTFSSHLCFSRIRVFALLFIAIAATSGLNYLWMKYKNHRSKYLRYFVLGIGVLMVVEVLTVSHLIMKISHVNYTVPTAKSSVNKFQNISSLPRPANSPGSILITYDAIRMNLGWLRGYGDSYLPGNTVRIGRDEPGYVGEFHQNGRVAEPVYWSPNRILLKGLDPRIPLVVNMNPGSPWYNNGKQLFPQYRVVEMHEPFEVMPDANGVVELTYRYPGQKLAILGTIFWIIVSVAAVMIFHRNRSKQSMFINAPR